MRRSLYKLSAFVILLLLVFAGSFPFLVRNSYAQTSNSCPDNMVLRGAYYGGAPRNLNLLLSPGFLNIMTNRGIDSVLSPLSVPDNNDSIVDWMTHNANYTQWTMNITPGLKWSDGTPITSADILATYSNKFAFNSSYDFTGAHAEVTSETALNSSAVQFNLNKSDALFPITIGNQVLTSVAPAEVINQQGPTATLFNAPDSGPWQSVNYTAGDTTMKLIRNPYYSPKVGPCELDMSFPETRSTIANLLIGGSIDFGPIDTQSAAAVLATPNLHIMDEVSQNNMQLNYNITLYPLNMTAFRQALVFAINQSAVVQQAEVGYATTAYSSEGTVPNFFKTVYDPNQMNYTFNPQQALTLLASIGITKGSDGLLHYKNGTAVSLSITAGNNADEAITTRIVVADLNQIGITTTVTSENINTLFGIPKETAGQIVLSHNGAEVFPSPQFDALPGWDVYTVPPLANIHWMYPPNIDSQYYSNLSVIQKTTDSAQVTKAINNIQQLGAQYLPVIILAWPDVLYGYSTARWINWPQYPSTWMQVGGVNDNGLFSSLQPANINAQSSSSTSSSASTVLSSSSASSSSTSNAASSSSSSSASSYTNTAGILAVIVIVIGVAVALFFRRERGKPR